jgi:DNA-directed RNA polymerase subunit M/transcription elongation factor TFIIS
MKPLVMRGCPKCGGALAQDAIEKEEDGTYTVELACVTCGKRVYRRGMSLNDVSTRKYGN